MHEKELPQVGLLQLASSKKVQFVIYDRALIGREDLDSRIKPDINLSGLDQARTVSRRHALVYREDDRFLIKSVKSRNHIRVNGEKVGSEARVIQDRDNIYLGHLLFSFRIVSVTKVDAGELQELKTDSSDKNTLQTMFPRLQMIQPGQEPSAILVLQKGKASQSRLYSIMASRGGTSRHLIVKFACPEQIRQEWETLVRLEKRGLPPNVLRLYPGDHGNDGCLVLRGSRDAPISDKLFTLKDLCEKWWELRLDDLLVAFEKLFLALARLYDSHTGPREPNSDWKWRNYFEILTKADYDEMFRKTVARTVALFWPERFDLKDFKNLLRELNIWDSRERAIRPGRIHGNLHPANILVSLDRYDHVQDVFLLGMTESGTGLSLALDLAFLETEFLQEIWETLAEGMVPQQLTHSYARAREALELGGNSDQVSGLPLFRFLSGYRKLVNTLIGGSKKPASWQEYYLTLCCFQLKSLTRTATQLDEARQMLALAGAYFSWQTFRKGRGYQEYRPLRDWKPTIPVPKTLPDFCEGDTSSNHEYYSCFISYSERDAEFVDKLYADLHQRGVDCWCSRSNIQSGQQIYQQIKARISQYEKVVVVLSESSMSSDWVKIEITLALDQGKLHPIKLVDQKKFEHWEFFDHDLVTDIGRKIRSFFMPDFSSWRNEEEYAITLERLLRDLSKSNP